MVSFERNAKGQILKRDTIPAREEISIVDKDEYLSALNSRKAALTAEIARVDSEISKLAEVPEAEKK